MFHLQQPMPCGPVQVRAAGDADADDAADGKAAADEPEATDRPARKPGGRPAWAARGRPFRGGGPRPRVAILGGTGRVGAWTARELSRAAAGDVDIVIAGRRADMAERLRRQVTRARALACTAAEAWGRPGLTSA
jgi:hypothetical protein